MKVFLFLGLLASGQVLAADGYIICTTGEVKWKQKSEIIYRAKKVGTVMMLDFDSNKATWHSDDKSNSLVGYEENGKTYVHTIESHSRPYHEKILSVKKGLSNSTYDLEIQSGSGLVSHAHIEVSAHGGGNWIDGASSKKLIFKYCDAYVP